MRKRCVHVGMLLVIPAILVALPVALSDAAGRKHQPHRHRTVRVLSRFTLRRHHAMVVSGHLVIVSRSDIAVGGTIVLLNGSGLDLLARGKVTISGRIRSTGGGHAAADAVAAGPPQKPAPILIDGSGVTLGGSGIVAAQLKGAPGQDIDIAARDRGDVRINAGIVTERGHNAATASEPGQSAGSVHIGDSSAIGQARHEEATTLQTPLFSNHPPTPPGLLRITRTVIGAGNGGTGFNIDQNGGTTNPCPGGANGVDLTATRGGDGGGVFIVARTVEVDDTTRMEAGFGGSGGDVSAKAADGESGHGGANVTFRTGDGGNGGSVYVAGVSKTFPGGLGGWGGNFHVRAGSGGDIAPGGESGCAGGKVRGTVGTGGHPGINPPPPAFAQSPSRLSGGSGGHAYAAFAPGKPGGKAGTVFIVSAGGPRETIDQNAEITGFNGGIGSGGCHLSPPGAGGSGGDSPGLVLYTRTHEITDAFNGGDGGDGDPVGLGGSAGVLVNGIPNGTQSNSFNRGQDGKPCQSSVPPCTGHAMLGNIYGGQAHELVSDFTCPKASTEFALTVPSGYQITGGQASNAASSGGYACNLNATSTTVDCTGTAPAGSTTYVQMTTSPNPQAGMMLPLKVSFSDKSTTSFTLTSH